MEEIWIKMNGFKHEVSNLGRIRKNGKLLSPSIFRNRNGRPYYRISIVNEEGRYRTLLIHRCVAEYFCEKVEGTYVVCHKDNDGLNNKSSNLYWGTQVENMVQAYRDGLMPSRKGVDNPNYKNGNWIKT